MKRKIKEVNCYVLNNPFISREPLREKIMRSMYLIYKKYRIFISKWVPLEGWQKHMWSFGSFSSKNKITNEAKIGKSKKQIEQSLLFSIKSLSILELIPKEETEAVFKGIKKFRNKHSKSEQWLSNIDSAKIFDGFFEGEAFSTVDDLNIKEKSKLSKYINEIHFSLVNLTSSFCALKIVVCLNKELEKNLSSFIIGNVAEQKKITGYEMKKWFQFRNLNITFFSGSKHKYETLENIVSDIKWNVLKELSKYIDSMIFHSKSINTPSIYSIFTDIDKNENKYFWNSINVQPQKCDFFDTTMSSCIAWRDRHNSPLYIFSDEEGDIKTNASNSYWEREIGGLLAPYLIANGIEISVREDLVKHSRKVAKLKQKNIKYWLKEKVGVDMQMFYAIRFVNEYKNFAIKNEDISSFINIYYNKNPLIFKLHKKLDEDIAKTNILYNDIMSLYQKNMEYRSAKTNYRMQRIALLISVISVIIAVIAVLVTLYISVIDNNTTIFILKK